MIYKKSNDFLISKNIGNKKINLILASKIFKNN